MSTAAPCIDCKTTGGFVPKRQSRPGRTRGRCLKCHCAAQYAKKRKAVVIFKAARRPEPPTLPVPLATPLGAILARSYERTRFSDDAEARRVRQAFGAYLREHGVTACDGVAYRWDFRFREIGREDARPKFQRLGEPASRVSLPASWAERRGRLDPCA